MGRLEGKVALVTGGAQGIGEAVCRLFARENATVICADLQADKGRSVASDIVAAGGRATFAELDITSESAWQETITALTAAHGQLDVLVNNAGGGIMGTVRSTSLEDFQWNLRTNVEGTFLGCQAACRAMDRGSSIVNVASIAALTATAGNIGYSAAKGAVRAFTRSLSAWGAPRGIRANTIFPGLIRTDALTRTEDLLTEMRGKPVEETRAMLVAQIPLGHVGEVTDIAFGALYLASDESKFVTGAEFVIDGGQTAV